MSVKCSANITTIVSLEDGWKRTSEHHGPHQWVIAKWIEGDASYPDTVVLVMCQFCGQVELLNKLRKSVAQSERASL